MTYLLSDGGRVLSQDIGSVLTVMACLLWASIVTAAAMRGPDEDSWTLPDRFSLAMGGWLVALFLIAAPTFVLGATLGLRPDLTVTIVVLAASAGCLVLVIRQPVRQSNAAEVLSLLGLLSLFMLSIWIRLAFVARASLPLYFDSAEHYRIIRALMQEYGQGLPSNDLTWPVSTYYHLGFHLIVSLLAFITTQNVAKLILVSGQIVLAAIPMCLFVVVRREARSTAAGFMAVILGIAGWYMPAYAVNWGKYPALFSLPPILFCLEAAYLAGRSEGSRKRALLILSACAAGVAFLMQTRSIILLAIALAAWWLSGRWLSRSGPQRWLVVGLINLILVVQAVVIGFDPILSGVLDPYIGNGASITAFVALLGIAALRKHPRLAFACLSSIMLLWLGLYLPVPGFAASSLLDRPLVEMVLFVPLALIGAAGLAAVMKHFADIAAPVKAAGMALLCAAIMAHALINYSLYPSDCCTLVHSDDLVALDWIGRNLPADARIAIPYAELQDAPAPYPPLSANTDAGVWITPLTGRRTTSLPYSTDFGRQASLDQLCRAGVSEVYVSEMSQGFKVEYLDGEPGWYELQLSLPGVRIYRIIGCVT
jgi:hypothetical protein